MEWTLIYEDEHIRECYKWIIEHHNRGLCPVTRPVWPGCEDGATLQMYRSLYQNGVWIYESRSISGARFAEERFSPLYQYYMVETYLTSDLPLPPEPVLGCAVIFGDRVALYPGSEPNPEAEPLWVGLPVLRASPDMFLRETISRNGKTGIIPYRLFLAEGDLYPYDLVAGNYLNLDVPTVSNRQCSANLVGYALTPDGEVVYLHLVGSQAGVKSLAATVIQGKILTLFTPWHHSVTGLKEDREYRFFLWPVPQTRLYRAILVAKSAMPDGSANDRAFFVSRNEDFAALARRLDILLPIPIKEEWGEKLYEEAMHGLIFPLQIGGDVRMGVRVNTDVSRWEKLISCLLQDGTLTI